jgi:uncharacterized membrane protein YqaE (UPF0057 family)
MVNANLIIKYVCAVLLPPVGVFLEKGLGTEFWLDLLLTFLIFFPGIIYACYIIYSANKGGLTGGVV